MHKHALPLIKPVVYSTGLTHGCAGYWVISLNIRSWLNGVKYREVLALQYSSKIHSRKPAIQSRLLCCGSAQPCICSHTLVSAPAKSSLEWAFLRQHKPLTQARPISACADCSGANETSLFGRALERSKGWQQLTKDKHQSSADQHED